ncbi:MAG TPA: hypothetical protein DEF51_02870, partial [Myxococcales bacterium]|nr:hypothetical protein [Myxococcales bacterium]
SIRGHVEAARADPNLVPVYTEESLLPFVENVAHIRFNAWHYAEANLWASLAAQIFRELLTSTEASEDGAIPPYRREQIENLIGKLGVAEDAARTARQDLDEARHAANRARKNLSQRRKARAEAEAELSKTRQPVGWESIELDVRSLEPVMQALGLGDAAPDVEALVELADESRGLAGHLRYLLTATLGGQRPDRAVVTRALVTFGGIAGGGVILALLINLFAPQIANVVAWLSAMIGAAGGAGRWLGPHIQTVNAHIGRLRQARDAAVEQKREVERRARAEERAAADALAVAESAETAARLSYEEKQDAYERAADLHRGERPGELFLRLIEERAGEDGYRKHLGLVSQLHDDFQLMSELLVRQAERRETGANADPSDELPAIDRIVLYIDDLDRCPDETVVKVLEAVHLLLALPLFVVVVGVDARWLEGALERQYAAQLSSNEIRPEDYLEKIFQLPYWLRRLDTRESGSFHSLTASLLTREEKAAYQSWRDRRSKPETPDSREGEHDESPDEATDTDGVASALGRIRLKPEERETIESVREAVALTPEEVAVIGALAPLVGKSPRSTKRFMNLYRFEKARRMQKEAGLFMGEGDETPEYLSVMVVLALAVGFDPETFDILMRQTGLLAAAKRSVNAEKGDSSREDAPPSFYRRLAGGGTDKADTAYIRFKPVVEKIAAAGDGLAKFRKVEDIDRQIAQLARAGRLPRLTFKRPYQA